MQIDSQVIEHVLEEYLAKFMPAMLRWRYHLILVKGGPEYAHLPEQSHFAHIVNGVFGLTELTRFLVEHRVLPAELDEVVFREALALFTVHEVHKAQDYQKLDATEFGIPVTRLREEYERLGLSDFAVVDEYLMRSGNIHKRSPRQGDMLLSEQDDGSFLWLLVRIADTFASVKTPKEAVASLMNYLKMLGPAFAPKSPPGKFALYYHEIRDIRGILTNALHTAVAQSLGEQLGLYPLLFFPTGTLYIGPSSLHDLERSHLIQDVITATLTTLARLGESDDDAIRGGQRAKNYDYETYVYSFASVPKLLELVRDNTITATVGVQAIVGEEGGFAKLLTRKGLPPGWTNATIDERFVLSREESKEFLEHWARVERYLLYVDKMLRQLAPSENAMEWLLTQFALPDTAAASLREVGELWAKGGPGKYVVPIAYHFLRGEQFAERPAETLTANQVVEKLHHHVLQAIETLDMQAGREAAVKALGFRQDLTIYLDENLYLSFAPGTNLHDDSLAAYSKPKRKSPETAFCALCGRGSDHIQEARSGILGDFVQVFSNRMLPVEIVQGNRSWCPTCHLEFILRKLMGMSLPSGAHYKKSYRINLYVLPTFSFTRDHLRFYRPFLEKFHQVTNIPVRDFDKEWGLPHYWIQHRELDPNWMERLEELLEREARKIAKWGGRAYLGERISTASSTAQPHYYLISWEKTARESEQDVARIATRTEAWAKALFSAAIISGFTSCKVYVTERPYLPFSDPSELKATITLDGPPPALRGMLNGQPDSVTLYGREGGRRSGLEQVLDLSAALWLVTTMVHAPDRTTKDKDITKRLALTNVTPLAGAHFYKEFSRSNDGKSPLSPLDTACELLLDIQGGDLMNLVEDISRRALDIRLPRRSYERGKVHNYELTFREGVAALRKAFALVPELRETAVTGRQPTPEALAELKALASGTLLKTMERRRTPNHREAIINPWHKDLNQLIGDFINVLVDEVYHGRAGGSFARFLRLENSLADGVFYVTDRSLPALWDQYNQQKAERQAQSAASS